MGNSKIIWKRKIEKILKMLLIVTLLFTAFVQMNALNIPGIDYPLTAQCAIKWDFPSMSCAMVKSKILEQIAAWGMDKDCAGSQRCLYKLKASTDNQITASHTTPIKRYVDSLTFTFNDAAAGCKVDGFSKSDLWYAVLDYGTNYCNLNNLITGAKLHESNGYVEDTRDKVCTQYSSRNCDIY